MTTEITTQNADAAVAMTEVSTDDGMPMWGKLAIGTAVVAGTFGLGAWIGYVYGEEAGIEAAKSGDNDGAHALAKAFGITPVSA